VTDFSFSASTTTSSNNGDVVTVDIAKNDLDNLKELANLAVSLGSTFLGI